MHDGRWSEVTEETIIIIAISLYLICEYFYYNLTIAASSNSFAQRILFIKNISSPSHLLSFSIHPSLSLSLSPSTPPSLPSTSIVSWSPNGTLIWETSLATQVSLPLLSYTGEVVVSDGQTLEWLDKDGRSLAPPVRLFPVQGQLLDLTITLSTSIVTMVYRCGFISTYTVGRLCYMYVHVRSIQLSVVSLLHLPLPPLHLFLSAPLSPTDGIPIAGIWLNDTVDGLRGTFIPLSNPVMNNTRLYLLTAFRPDNS